MKNLTPLATFIFLAALAPLTAAPSPSLSQGQLPETLRAAFVQVELEAQTSDGESPPRALAEDMRADRSTITAGYLVAHDLVIAPDLNLPPRFVRAWRVAHGTDASIPAVAARPVARATDRNAMLLKLDNPLPNTHPLEFSSAAYTPLANCFAVQYTAGTNRNTTIEPLSTPRWQVYPAGKRIRPIPPNSIIATDASAPLALVPTDALRTDDDAWKTPWREWPWLHENEIDARLEKLTANAANALIYADLTLRPQPVRAGQNPNTTTRSATADPSAKPQPAIIITPRRVLVLAYLANADTARLENIILRLADGTRVNARFIGSVATHGALLVEPEHDIAAPIALSRTRPDWNALRDRLQLTIDLRLQGETRLARPGITRILSVGHGTRAVPAPSFTVPRLADTSNTLFLFDLDGNFLGCSLRPRYANTTDTSRAEIIAASTLASYTGNTRAWADTANVPLAEVDEHQLIWLGADLQPLTRELAREKGVAEQTRNGATGALVAKVYPDSPAARAGLQTGDVLLRIRRINSSQAISIDAGGDTGSSYAIKTLYGNPAQQIPDTTYDRIPPPWPPAEDSLNKMLKRIGAGIPLELDYARDGALSKVRFTAAKGPGHYGAAPEATLANIGLNVKALTFETRTFYNISDDKTALIVSRVVAGGRASIAGLRPYDLIVEMNDQPVTTPAEFSELAQNGARLRLLTRRMNQTRIVTLDTAAP